MASLARSAGTIVGGIQPLIVALLASKLLNERLSTRVIAAGLTGFFGVALITLQVQARLDTTGILAALGGTLFMATGIVLSKRWGQPASPLTTTSWQLIAGGLTLLIALPIFEGLPGTALTAPNIGGYVYLSLVGTAFAYVMWFRGIAALPARSTAFLGLLSTVVAKLLGWAVAGESLTPPQILGVLFVLGSISSVVLLAAPKRSGSAEVTPHRDPHMVE
ncbi:EamA family transporter [Jonesiaceae bacterium BS-20]|uniref:EamA family transporter n=1 Tax=Jonesiaceae bacterium BS-20 TaxID=3120821 RepID=A0AAU7DTF8_9MICO